MGETGEPAVRGGHGGTLSPAAGAALILGAATLWATFGLFAKHLHAAGFQTVELASVRATLAFAAFAGYALFRRLRHGTSGVAVPLRALPFFACYGIGGFALFTLCFFASMQHTTVAIAVALLYTAPAFVVLMSALLLHERVDRMRMLSLVLVLTGVLLVTGAAGSLLQGSAALSSRALLSGLGAGAGYAAYTMFSKAAAQRYGALPSLFWCFCFAALALALFASPLTPFMRAPRHAPLLLMLGIVPTILPYALFLTGLRALRASTASMLATIEPVMAALFAALLLGEKMGLAQVAGMGLVVLAAALLARGARGESGSAV